MSPTFYREGKYRFFVNSREESRKHIHVQTADGMAKFWLEPIIALDVFQNLSSKELREIEDIVRSHREDFENEWNSHFSQ